MVQQHECRHLAGYLRGGCRVRLSSSWGSMTHRKVDQAEEAAADRLWRGVHEAQIPHLGRPEGLAPMRRQLAGRIQETPSPCMLLAQGDCYICTRGYELLRCKQSQALMSIVVAAHVRDSLIVACTEKTSALWGELAGRVLEISHCACCCLTSRTACERSGL